ncbi:MAG: hypothetical protein EOM62_18680 [Bacteroidia bacterium]|nr:hypothetical protein [Bacteroidia bacterium]
MTTILHQYTDYMALAEIGCGDDIPSRVDKSKLLKLLDELPDGEIYVSMLPHANGKCVIVKPCSLTEPSWWLLCPKEEAKA